MHLFCLLHFTFLLHQNQQSSRFWEEFQDCRQGKHVITWMRGRLGLMRTFNWHFASQTIEDRASTGCNELELVRVDEKVLRKDLVLIGPSAGSGEIKL